MTTEFRDMTAVVTGAGRGIGRCIATRLGRAGATVVAVARTQSEIRAAAEEIRGEGGHAFAITADVGDEAQVRDLFLFVEKEWGRLDILINNAGVGRYGPLIEFSTDDFDAIMRSHVRGTFLCSRAALRLMLPRRQGYIINMSSVLGLKGYANQSVYTAAKHAVMGLTKALAVEAQPHGIRVSAILPGGVDTEMVRRARPDLNPAELLQPEDIAQAVEYLLSLSERAAVDQIYVRRRNSQPF